MKKSAAVSELKANLSRYLARVKRGEEVVVTERGEPIAKLVPLPPAEDSEMARLRRMEGEGLVRIGTGKLPPDFWDWPRPADPQGLLLKALLEDREAGR